MNFLNSLLFSIKNKQAQEAFRMIIWPIGSKGERGHANWGNEELYKKIDLPKNRKVAW